MKFKPLRDYSEHDVLNFFKLVDASGDACTPVVIANSGWNNNNGTPKVHSNLAAGNQNIYSPRWDIYPAVRKAVSGEKPLGLTLYATNDKYFDNDQLQQRVERQAVVSGEAVPVVRKGLFLIGPFPSGETPAPGKFIAVKGTGDLGVIPTASAAAFGDFLGTKDTDGYALVHINCYI